MESRAAVQIRRDEQRETLSGAAHLLFNLQTAAFKRDVAVHLNTAALSSIGHRTPESSQLPNTNICCVDKRNVPEENICKQFWLPVKLVEEQATAYAKCQGIETAWSLWTLKTGYPVRPSDLSAVTAQNICFHL